MSTVELVLASPPGVPYSVTELGAVYKHTLGAPEDTGSLHIRICGGMVCLGPSSSWSRWMPDNQDRFELVGSLKVTP